MPFLESVGSAEDISALKSFLADVNSKNGTDYHSTFNAFALAAKIVNSNDKIEAGAAALCRQMAADGVVYAEIRTGLKDFGSGLEEYLAAVLRGVKAGCLGTCLEVKIILSLKRTSTAEMAWETLNLITKYRGEGVVGLDLSDNSMVGDGAAILGIMEEVQRLGIPVTLHLGECAEETEAQQMRELNSIRPSRIGHGVFLCPAAKEWIYSRRIPIEMCLSSALKAHMVSSVEQHPALQLILESDYPVAICTDDPLIFETDHVKESLIALEALQCDLTKIAELHQKSLLYKF